MAKITKYYWYRILCLFVVFTFTIATVPIDAPSYAITQQPSIPDNNGSLKIATAYSDVISLPDKVSKGEIYTSLLSLS